MARVCAVIVAGGVGSRFGNPGGKQLVPVLGRPLMSWCIAAFDAAERVGHIVLVCPSERAEQMRELAVEPCGFATPITFAEAGKTRQDSTREGMEAIPAGFDVVAIHDGARPLVTPQVIDGVCERLEAAPAAAGVVCGQPAIDTLKLVEGDRFVATPDRTRYWTVQTPQVFRLDALRRAFELAEAEGFVGTDDASIVERLGEPVLGFTAPRDNLKLTVPEDLAVVEALLKRNYGE